jgi:3-oxoacyl-[acyl-carrier protein] reductase
MSGRVVLVTGGGRGIGRAICERFAASGAQTVAAARSTDELAETKQLIEQRGGLCHIQPTDVSSAEEVKTLADVAAEKFGRIDVLVNGAGVAPLHGIEELDARIFQAILSVNVVGVYHGCRAVWPIMKRQGFGVIINISSIASVDPFPGLTAYGASKAWINLWTKALAEEGRACGIRVYAVAPGAVDTKMLRDLFPDYAPERTLRPAEVAETVFALAEPAFQHATGQVVFVQKE